MLAIYYHIIFMVLDSKIEVKKRSNMFHYDYPEEKQFLIKYRTNINKLVMLQVTKSILKICCVSIH